MIFMLFELWQLPQRTPTRAKAICASDGYVRRDWLPSNS